MFQHFLWEKMYYSVSKLIKCCMTLFKCTLCDTINTYWLCPRETVCFVDPRLSKKYQKSKKWQTKANYIRKYMKYFISKINEFNLENNNVNSVQRSRLHVMAHVIFFVIHRWMTRCLPLALMRGRQSNFVTLTWCTLDQWNTWKGELWLLVYNNLSCFIFIMKWIFCSSNPINM